jgi:hypothetical protein
MNDLHNRIAEIIAVSIGVLPQREIASEILSAMADGIEPLVWDHISLDSCTAPGAFGNYLVEICGADEGFGMWPPGADQDKEPPLGYHKTSHIAQKAADTLNRITIMATFGVMVV